MKTARIIGCVVALIVGVYITSCSAQTDTASQYSSEGNRIQRLQQIYENPQSSELDRLGAATELVRLGVRNPKYWSHVQSEGRASLQREKLAAREWQKQQTVVASSDTIKRVAVLQRRADTMTSLGSSTSDAMVSSGTVKVTGYTENRSVVERDDDASNLPGVIALAASKRPEALKDLRRTVDGTNVLMAAEAALGLANLKDHEWIPHIVDAAHRFDEDFLFARALVYFGTTNANEEAARLLRDDPELFEEMKATAQARGYEPFGAK